MTGALMGLAPAAPAQTSDPESASAPAASGSECASRVLLWECHWDQPPPTNVNGTQGVAGWFRNPAEITKVTLMLRQLDGPGCMAPDQAVDPPVTADGTYAFSFRVTPPCNGSYTLSVEAQSTYVVQPTNSLNGGSVAVEIPPPAVTAVVAVVNADRTVTVRWSDANPVADLQGYQVERSVNGGSFSAVGSRIPKGTTRFTDSSPPGDATALRYQVRSIRPGATSDRSPVTAVATGQPVDFTLPTTTTLPTDTTVPPADDSGGGGGGVGGGGGGSGGGGSVSGSARRPTPTTIPLPDLAPTTVPDDIEPGDPDPVLPDDEFATGSVVQNFDDDSDPNRELLVPVAGGMVLLVWAMHLRLITRQAATTVGWDE